MVISVDLHPTIFGLATARLGSRISEADHRGYDDNRTEWSGVSYQREVMRDTPTVCLATASTNISGGHTLSAFVAPPDTPCFP